MLNDALISFSRTFVHMTIYSYAEQNMTPTISNPFHTRNHNKLTKDHAHTVIDVILWYMA